MVERVRPTFIPAYKNGLQNMCSGGTKEVFKDVDNMVYMIVR